MNLIWIITLTSHGMSHALAYGDENPFPRFSQAWWEWESQVLSPTAIPPDVGFVGVNETEVSPTTLSTPGGCGLRGSAKSYEDMTKKIRKPMQSRYEKAVSSMN